MPAACAPCGPCRNLSESMAEGVGFEPTREREPPGGFQDRCLKPLGHPSFVGARRPPLQSQPTPQKRHKDFEARCKRGMRKGSVRLIRRGYEQMGGWSRAWAKTRRR